MPSNDRFKFIRRHIPNVELHHQGLMLALWNQGYDTNAIAKRLGLHEWQVANELPRLREAIRNAATA